jgi:hypothetical protein
MRGYGSGGRGRCRRGGGSATEEILPRGRKDSLCRCDIERDIEPSRARRRANLDERQILKKLEKVRKSYVHFVFLDCRSTDRSNRGEPRPVERSPRGKKNLLQLISPFY